MIKFTSEQEKKENQIKKKSDKERLEMALRLRDKLQGIVEQQQKAKIKKQSQAARIASLKKEGVVVSSKTKKRKVTS